MVEGDCIMKGSHASAQANIKTHTHTLKCTNKHTQIQTHTLPRMYRHPHTIPASRDMKKNAIKQFYQH